MKSIYIFIFFLFSSLVFAQNQSNQSFNKAKKLLEKKVFNKNKITIYCNASFTSLKNVIPPKGFKSDKYKKRSRRIEWEHVVPAENFGRTFKEWREGDPLCVTKKGKAFKGRNCASKLNVEYRYMQSDMFNILPAIGSVNALRRNYNFTLQPGVANSFGSCEMKIKNKKAEPPEVARGQIARIYMYMDATYPRYSISKQQRKLMNAWDKMYPVDSWECERTKKITKLQQSTNAIVQQQCIANNLW